MKIQPAFSNVAPTLTSGRAQVTPGDGFQPGMPTSTEGLSRAQLAELMRTDVTVLETWTAQVPAGTRTAPAIGQDGTLYIPTGEGVSALKADGSPLWTWKGTVEPGSTPTVLDDGSVLTPGGHKNEGLVKIGPDGNTAWKRDLPAAQEEPAVIPGGGLYYADYGGTLHRLGDDGAPAWTWKAPDGAYGPGTHLNGGPAVLPDGSAVVIADPGALHAVNPDGTPKWTRFGEESDTDRASTVRQPLVTPDGDLLVTGGSNDLFCLDPATGETRWQFLGSEGKRMDQLTPQERADYSGWGNTLLSGSPQLSPDGQTVYIGGMNGRVTALDRAGNRKWEIELDENGYHEPCTVGEDGNVYYVGHQGSVHAVSPEGKRMWTFQPNDDSQYAFVAAKGDTVYLSTSEGRVHALSNTSLRKRLERAERDGVPAKVEITDAQVIIGGVALPRQRA